MRRVLVPLCLVLAACGGEAPSELVWTLDGARGLSLRLDAEHGTVDVLRGGTLVLRRATADALIDGPAGPRALSLSGTGCARERRGDGSIVCAAAGGLELELSIEVPPGKEHLVARARITNRSAEPITVLRLSPLVADAKSGGALFLGDHPRDHRILENGRFALFDQTAQLVAGDAEPFALAGALPIEVRGRSVSNWSQVIAQPGGSGSLVAGYLEAERTVPTIGVGFDPDALSAELSDAGRVPFTTWAADCALLFHGKVVPPGESLGSELLYVDPLPIDPLEGLERYAESIAEHLGLTPWTKRAAGDREVPSGWNSWTGGAATGGHGQSIDETRIRHAIELARTELLPFGFNHLPIDDGWQEATGDWQFRRDRFPTGGAGMAEEIRRAGLSPGLWIAPFSVSASSTLARTHPKWLSQKEDGFPGAAAKEGEALDVSSPDARAFIRETLAGVKAQGYSWVKADFTYWSVLGKPRADPSLTNVEAWRAGWKEMREALGPDVFLLGIGMIGASIGPVDGMRLTLDNAPWWEEPSPDGLDGRGMKGTVRTGSRRWFYNHRAFVNHGDLIFFRSAPAGRAPPISFEESRTFATWVALGGGIVKIGDRFDELEAHPEWIDVLRKLLPVWPEGARPVDVLVRDYPERWQMRVKAPAGEWDLVGLFNWGTNRDWSVNPPAPLAEAPRRHAIFCEGECVAFELWSEELIRFSGTAELEVEPRRVKVLAIRPARPHPQIVSSNRHVTQGATDLLEPPVWNESTRRLSGAFRAAAGTPRVPHETRLSLHVPAGFSVDRVEIEDHGAPALEVKGEHVVIALSVRPEHHGRALRFEVSFRR